MAGMGDYLSNLKNRNANRAKMIKNKAKDQRRRELYKEKEQKKINEIKSWPRDYVGRQQQLADKREGLRQKYTMSEAEREEYNQPKEPQRPEIARSEKEAADAYNEKTIPGYREQQAQWKRYLKQREQEAENERKNRDRRILEEGNGPRVRSAKSYRTK